MLFLVSLIYSRSSKHKLSILKTIRVKMAEPGDFEIIAGVGNEVFYFFGTYPFYFFDIYPFS